MEDDPIQFFHGENQSCGFVVPVLERLPQLVVHISQFVLYATREMFRLCWTSVGSENSDPFHSGNSEPSGNSRKG